MSARIAFSILASLCCLAINPSRSAAATISQPEDISFAATLGNSAEIDIASLNEKIQMYCPGDRCRCFGGDCSQPKSWYRSSASGVGSNQRFAQLSKDSSTLWASADICVPGDDILYWWDDKYLYPDVWYINGTEYRTGPTVWSPVPTIRGAATLAPGVTLPSPFESPQTLRFLTGASYEESGNFYSTYTLNWNYANRPPYVHIITISAVNSQFRSNAEPGIQVNYGREFREVADCNFPKSYLDEVIVENPYPDATLVDVQIYYTPESLAGPVAVSMGVTELDYANAANFQGYYASGDSAIPADAGESNAIWYGVSWSNILDDGGSPRPIPFGDVMLAVECGDSGAQTWQFAGEFSNLSGDAAGVIHPLDVGDGSYCSGKNIRYQVDIEAYLGTSPSMDSLVFHFDIDADEDGVGIFGYRVDGSPQGAPDCDDSNSDIWQLDCEGVCGGPATDCPIFTDGFEDISP